MAEKTSLIKKGEILIIQGEASSRIIYLMKGSVELLSAPEEYSGLDRNIIIEHSNRVGLIAESSYLAGISGRTLRAVTDCEVQIIPDGGLVSFTQQDPAGTVMMLSHLFRRLESSLADLNKIAKLYQNICVVSDNLSLMSKEVSAGELPQRLDGRAENLYESFKKSNAAMPKILDHQFLLTDRSVSLNKKYTIPGEPVETIFDKELCAYFKRFAKIDKNIFAHTIKADPEIGVFMFEKVSGYLVKVYDKIAMVFDSIEDEMELLFGAEDSWARYLAEYGAFRDWERSGKISPDFAKNFATLSSKIFAMFGEIAGKDLTAKFPGLLKMKEYFARAQAVKSPSSSASAKPASPATNSSRLFSNSLQQIFEYAVAPNEFCTQMTKLINEFLKLENPFVPDDDARKLRRQISKLYWQLYSQVYIRSLKEKQIPAPVKLMIQFGFIDERLVDADQVEVLHRLSQMNQKTDIPAMFEYEFLQKIYLNEEPPSLNEVGLTFEKQIREEIEKSGKSSIDPEDPLRKVDYEIQNRIQSTVGICSGSRSTAFPILTSHLIRGNPEQFFVSKSKITETIRELLEIDYSAFYRETVTKLNEPVIFEEEILPYIILMPSFGTKTMMWQELVGTNKRSRARFVIPVFFMGDLRRSLAHSIASFRWEINRSMQGAMWADPIEGGLTGAFYDYVQFFRKNPRLSPEAKEKLHERIKGVRNNMKELFCEDYVMWLLYEREGTMKLNNVVRDIFYRNIPFKKEIRDRLETMPAFIELANKFKNVRQRKVKEYDNKFKKYRDATGNLPPALQKFMDYLKF
jgi:hypothetical protein